MGFSQHLESVESAQLCMIILVAFMLVINFYCKFHLVYSGNKAYFLCPTSKCGEKKTVRDGTFLFNCRSSLARIILLLYTFTQITWTYDQGKLKLQFRKCRYHSLCVGLQGYEI